MTDLDTFDVTTEAGYQRMLAGLREAVQHVFDETLPAPAPGEAARKLSDVLQELTPEVLAVAHERIGKAVLDVISWSLAEETLGPDRWEVFKRPSLVSDISAVLRSAYVDNSIDVNQAPTFAHPLQVGPSPEWVAVCDANPDVILDMFTYLPGFRVRQMLAGIVGREPEEQAMALARQLTAAGVAVPADEMLAKIAVLDVTVAERDALLANRSRVLTVLASVPGAALATTLAPPSGQLDSELWEQLVLTTLVATATKREDVDDTFSELTYGL